MREGVGVRRYPKQEAGGSCDAPRQEWGATGNWRGLSQQLGSQQGIHLTKLGSPRRMGQNPRGAAEAAAAVGDHLEGEERREAPAFSLTSSAKGPLASLKQPPPPPLVPSLQLGPGVGVLSPHMLGLHFELSDQRSRSWEP